LEIRLSDKKKKSLLSRIAKPLRFLVSFGAIGVILYLFRDQMPAVIDCLAGAKISYFLAAVVIFFAGLTATALRLKFVLQVNDANLSLGNSYYVNIIALFFNNVLPSSVGGEMVKAYYIYKSTSGNVASFSAVFVDRLFGLVTMVAIGVVAVLLCGVTKTDPKILYSILLLAAVTCMVAILIFSKTIVDSLCSLRIPFVPEILLEKLREMYKAMYVYRGHNRIVFSCIVLTLIGQLTYILANYLLARSLSLPIPLSFFFFFVPIMLVMTMAPSVNGIGVREAAYLFYLQSFVEPDKALALSLFSTFFVIFVGVAGGVVYAFKGGLPAGMRELEGNPDEESSQP
jgi:uncharacterized protein (TIRG00374 family)